MIGIAFVLLPLAIFPLLVTLYFQFVVKERKKQDVMETLGRHGAWQTEREPGIRTLKEDKVNKEFEEFYQPSSFWLPAGLLTFLYIVAISVGAAYLANLGDSGSWPFAKRFIEEYVSPVLIAVVSVYLFNMQHTLRRVYLSDLTPNVFLASVYRTLLVAGLAISIAYGFPAKTGSIPISRELGPAIFFAFGFLATDVLTAVLVFAQAMLQRVFQWSSGRVKEKGLTLIQGINLWNAYRLEEEGIENVQQLATCDVITLTLKTHYELKTILDWVDQAILLLRLGTPEQARKLRVEGLINSAIDMAWLSQGNNDDNGKASQRIATILGVEESDVQRLMTSLYEDENLRFLWYLWQSRREFDQRQPK
jgi:hypothetical protein